MCYFLNKTHFIFLHLIAYNYFYYLISSYKVYEIPFDLFHYALYSEPYVSLSHTHTHTHTHVSHTHVSPTHTHTSHTHTSCFIMHYTVRFHMISSCICLGNGITLGVLSMTPADLSVNAGVRVALTLACL